MGTQTYPCVHTHIEYAHAYILLIHHELSQVCYTPGMAVLNIIDVTLNSSHLYVHGICHTRSSHKTGASTVSG